ncbi:MAG: CPBP family intramembrane metalloprotease [Saprospiraceae bacterium]|nr:CPBP family intramembrane metalloprotease [Saprospiraceae bacterium]
MIFSNKSFFLLSLVALTITIFPYFFSTGPAKWIAKILKVNKSLDHSAWAIYLQRILGFIWLGGVAAVFMLIYENHLIDFYGFGLQKHKMIWLLVTGIIFIIQCINYFNASSASNLALYPQIRKEKWSFSLLVFSTFTWVLYVAAYEFLIRGVLLFSTLSVYNQATSIAINVGLYAIIHIPKGLKETLASIPFGVVMCLLTLESQSIWPAIVVHATLALSNEWFSLYYQPKMSVKWR